MMQSFKHGGGRLSRFEVLRTKGSNQFGGGRQALLQLCFLSFVILVYVANVAYYRKNKNVGSSIPSSFHKVSSIAIQSLIQEHQLPQEKEGEEVSPQQQHMRSQKEAAVPFRRLEDMEQDIRCLYLGQSHLHFYHLRKAGGSSIRHMLVNMTGMGATRHSMYISHSEGLTFSTTCLLEGPRVFVTSLRDPIERIISSFGYEGFLVRPDKRMYPNHVLPQEMQDIAQESKRSQKFVERVGLMLKEWIEEEVARYANEAVDFKQDHVWTDVENYYIKCLTNRYRDVSKQVTKEDLELAKRILASFDVVLITEWMREGEQTAYFNHMLGTTKYFASSDQLKSNKNRYATHGIDDEAIALLRKMNQLDMELYEYAKNLTRKRLDTFVSSPAGKLAKAKGWEVSGVEMNVEEEEEDDEIRMATCRVPSFPEPEYTYEGIKYAPTKNLYPDPVCMYPRDMMVEPRHR